MTIQMTPAIQTQITIQSPAVAEQLSDTITQIAKKIMPFPQNLRRPKLLVSIDLGQDKWVVGTGRRLLSGSSPGSAPCGRWPGVTHGRALRALAASRLPFTYPHGEHSLFNISSLQCDMEMLQ